MNIAVSNVYQKMGFFPGAHGIPDISRLEDDGNSRNIDLPYSKVNHLKVATHQQYLWNGVTTFRLISAISSIIGRNGVLSIPTMTLR